MDRALEAHQSPPPAVPRAGPPLLAERSAAAGRHKGCIHCHNVNEFRRADAKAADQWDRNSVWVYPLPENVGLTLDKDVANRVNAVAAGSPADKAGVKPGDLLTRLSGKPVASFADASYALHKHPANDPIPAAWSRAGREWTGSFAVAPGWRKTNLTWRPSMLDLLPSLPFGGDDLTAAEKKQLGLAADRAAFRQTGRVHSSLAAAGLQKGDVVLGADGQAVKGEIGDLLGFVRRNYLVGDTVTFDVLRDGKPVAVKVLLK